jgi:hypothetical protein
MGLCAIEVGEGGEDDRHLNLCASEDVVDEGGKSRVLVAASEGSTAVGVGRAAEGKVNGLDDHVYCVICW